MHAVRQWIARFEAWFLSHTPMLFLVVAISFLAAHVSGFGSLTIDFVVIGLLIVILLIPQIRYIERLEVGNVGVALGPDKQELTRRVTEALKHAGVKTLQGESADEREQGINRVDDGEEGDADGRPDNDAGRPGLDVEHHPHKYRIPPGLATAGINLTEQKGDGQKFVVESVYLPQGGFVGVFDDSIGKSDFLSSFRGHTEYLSPGYHSYIVVELSRPINSSQAALAMPFRDTNGNEEFDFISSDGADDGPYSEANGSVIMDAVSYHLEY